LVASLVYFPSAFGPSFDKCLQIDSRKRFDDAVEAADAFAELVRRTEKLSIEKQLRALPAPAANTRSAR
jgi:hypothetical protein